jgi:hypothetical protein
VKSEKYPLLLTDKVLWVATILTLNPVVTWKGPFDREGETKGFLFFTPRFAPVFISSTPA